MTISLVEFFKNIYDVRKFEIALYFALKRADIFS